MRFVQCCCLLLCFSQISVAQLQFNSCETGVMAVTTSGQYMQLQSFSLKQDFFSKNLVQAADGKLYGCNNTSISVVNSDGSNLTTLATLPKRLYSELLLGADQKLYYIDFDSKLYSLPLTGGTPMFLANAPDCKQLLSTSTGYLFGISTSPTQMLFRIKTDGTDYTILRNFTAAEGSGAGQLAAGPDGKIYGTWSMGGTNNAGSFFRCSEDGSNFEILHHFDYATDGQPSFETRLVYQNGKFFFTTESGSTYGYGAITAFTIATGTWTNIHAFGDPMKPNVGYDPNWGLTAANNGYLYGLTKNDHAVFRISENGSSLEVVLKPSLSSLYYFYQAYQPLLLLNDGSAIYLQSGSNGQHLQGFLLAIPTNNQPAYPVINFGEAPNGGNPFYGFAKDGTNRLYGVSPTGGAHGGGTVFRINADGTEFTILHHFGASVSGLRMPSGRLLLSTDGKLYGTCELGGYAPNLYKAGGVFSLNTDGTGFTVVKQFNDQPSSANRPIGGLTEDASGTLYGTTKSSVYYEEETSIFKVNKNGSNYTILKWLNPYSEGRTVMDALTLSGDYLYGACVGGGFQSGGTIFRIHTSGTNFQVIRQLSYVGTGGATPTSGLTVASNGRLFGVVPHGGSTGNGNIYSFLPDGSNFLIHRQFTTATDGGSVHGKLTQGSDGKLYGKTTYGGPSGGGAFFSINVDGTGFTVHRYLSNRSVTYHGPLVEVPLMTTLPVRFSTFEATKQNTSALLRWKASATAPTDFFVQKSADGLTFETIERVQTNTLDEKEYLVFDRQPFSGSNYYRIKAVEGTQTKFSSTKTLRFSQGGLTAYPNPATDYVLIQSRWGGHVSRYTITAASGVIVKQGRIAEWKRFPLLSYPEAIM